jgi:hypothetical protein
MCIVIDSCVLSRVFRTSDKGHAKFKPVCDWIVHGDGMLVFGGTKFTAEICDAQLWFIKFLRLLTEMGKAHQADTAKVDKRQKVVEGLVKDKDFDDPHLIALLGVTGCQLICTDDKRAEKYLLDKTLYPKKRRPPAIYKGGKTQSVLLTAAHTGKCCEPKKRLNKSTKAHLGLPIK